MTRDIQKLAADYARTKQPKSEEHKRKLSEAQKRRWADAKEAYEATQALQEQGQKVYRR
jgi:hypothetical protein